MFAAVKGTRLSYVVRPIKDNVKRVKHLLVPKKYKSADGKDKVRFERETKLVEEPGGYMVYFPKGHALRMKDDAMLRRYGLHLKPRLVNLTGLEDSNSPVGRLMASQDEDGRIEAWKDLEDKVVAMATKRSGRQLVTLVEKEAA